MKKAFVLTNHNTTEDQIRDLTSNWGILDIVELPANLKQIWGTIPPNTDCVSGYVQPVIDWLVSNCSNQDIVWVQGEWGATLTVIHWYKKNTIKAVYSTTKRTATETKTENGTIMTHVFKHVRFREFPKG